MSLSFITGQLRSIGLSLPEKVLAAQRSQAVLAEAANRQIDISRFVELAGSGSLDAKKAEKLVDEYRLAVASRDVSVQALFSAADAAIDRAWNETRGEVADKVLAFAAPHLQVLNEELPKLSPQQAKNLGDDLQNASTETRIAFLKCSDAATALGPVYSVIVSIGVIEHLDPMDSSYYPAEILFTDLTGGWDAYWTSPRWTGKLPSLKNYQEKGYRFSARPIAEINRVIAAVREDRPNWSTADGKLRPISGGLVGPPVVDAKRIDRAYFKEQLAANGDF